MKKSSRTSGKKPSRRNVVVLAGLLGALTLTSILLLVMTPAPLTGFARGPLMATDADDAMKAIDQTSVSIQQGRWIRVFIHHSRSHGGNLAELGNMDHFLIGDGVGTPEGAIEIGDRWDQQKAAGIAGLGERTISICVVGDFDQTAPTSAQVRQLERLVKFLHEQYGIAVSSIVSQELPGDVGGIGRFFPRTYFAQQLQR